MINNIFLSIIVPSYNSELYINRCLKSITDQKFSYPWEVECIIVNDCSTDNSPHIISDFIKKNNNPNIHFSLKNNNSNKGLSYSRNKGLEVASGEYILFVDSDDEISPDSLNIFWEYFNKYPNADFYQGRAKEIGSPKCFDPIYPKEYWRMPNEVYQLIKFLPVTAWNKFIKRNFLIENNLTFKEGIKTEDVHWTFRMITYTKTAVLYSKETYIYYTLLGGSITSQLKKDHLGDINNQIKVYYDLGCQLIPRKNEIAVLCALQNRYHHFKNAIVAAIIEKQFISKEVSECCRNWGKVINPKINIRNILMSYLLRFPNNSVTRYILKNSLKFNAN